MTQSEIEKVLARARAGSTLKVGYDSPRGLRRYEVKVVAVTAGTDGKPKKIRFERGTAAWVYIQRARIEGGELCWCFYQPNPYPVIDVAIV